MFGVDEVNDVESCELTENNLLNRKWLLFLFLLTEITNNNVTNVCIMTYTHTCTIQLSLHRLPESAFTLQRSKKRLSFYCKQNKILV